MATSVIHRISVHPIAETVPLKPYPDYGDNFDAEDLQSANWVCLGSRDRGDDANLDSESIGIIPIREGVNVRAAGALTNEAYIQRHNGISEITFTAYEATQNVFALDSSVVEGEGDDLGIAARSAKCVYRAVLVEVDGIRFDYYPRVALYVTNESAGFGPGDDAVHKYAFTGIVTATSDIPSGQMKYHYQKAAP